MGRHATSRANLHNVDLAALRTLCVVFEQRSFSKAAERLSVNQSAISYTIDKLRLSFDDPLFFRQGGKTIPTDHCVYLVERITRLLNEFEQLTSPVEFDPSNTKYNYVIACNYYERQMIIPLLMKTLRKTAPGIKLEIITSTSKGHLRLKRAEADLLIGPFRRDENTFYCQKLMSDHYVCIMDKNNPLASDELNMAAYISCNHAIVTYGGNWRSNYLKQLDALGLSLNNVLSVPSPAGLQEVLLGTDLVSTVPLRIALSFGPSIHISRCPCPAPFDIEMVWTTRTHHSVVHKWFRNLILSNVQSLP